MKTFLRLFFMNLLLANFASFANAQRVRNENISTVPLNSTIGFAQNLQIPARTSYMVAASGKTSADKENVNCQMVLTAADKDRILPAGSFATILKVATCYEDWDGSHLRPEVCLSLGFPSQVVVLRCAADDSVDGLTNYFKALGATLALSNPESF